MSEAERQETLQEDREQVHEDTGISFEFDYLTGLMGMRRFLACNEQIRETVKKENRIPDRWIVFFNLSSFKLYNVTYGIEAGDHVLKSIADILRDVFRTDIIARFADDHFVVSVKSGEVEAKTNEVIRRVSKIDTRSVLRMKAGLYHISDAAVRANEACDYAKLACDSIAKNMTRSVCIYDESLSERLKLDQYIVDHIREAIAKGWIEIVLQPVIRSLSGKVCGAEALSRWHDPVKGNLSPAAFIPDLEQAHLIHLLDTYVVKQACETIREVLDNGDEPVPISFNLSRLDFQDTDPVRVVEENVSRYDIPRDYLCVEITETALMQDTAVIQSAMDRFRKLGYQVWMDDFGSGYSSLNTLKDFTFDEIKIDMMFLSSFTERSRMILKSVISMAKEMKTQTLAEGVETKEQFEYLRSIGCEKVQGYYFGRPMNRADYNRNIEENGLEVEPHSMAGYYAEIGHVDMISDKPLALLEHDTGDFHPVFLNDAFQQILHEVGIESLEEAERRLNDKSVVTHNTYERFVKKVESGNREMVLVYPERDKMMRLEAQKVAQFGSRYMLRLSISYTEEREVSRKQKKPDAYLRSLAMVYDGVVAVHLKEGYIERVLSNGSFEMFEQRYTGLTQSFHLFAQTFIAPEDRERYLAFIDMDTLAERIRESGKGFISDQFRIYDTKIETFITKMLIAFLAPNMDSEIAFGMMRSV